MMFEPENKIVAEFMRDRIESGPHAGNQANRLYGPEISEVEERGFRVLDCYLSRLAEDGFGVEPDRRPLCVRITHRKATRSLKVRERFGREVDEDGTHSLTRTGNLCVEIDRLITVKEPDNDLLQSYPKVLNALKLQAVDTELLREMHRERIAKSQFEALIAPGPSSYEERVRDTVRQFQRMAASYAETRRAVDLLKELQAAGTEPDAATIEILKEYIRLIDPLAHGSDVALRLLTHVLHGRTEEEPSRFG